MTTGTNDYPSYVFTRPDGSIATIQISSRDVHAYFVQRRARLGWAERQVLRLIDRDGDACHLCREAVGFAPIQPPGDEPRRPYETLRRWQHARPTCDHVIPRVRRGSHSLDNLRLAHAYCNSRRGDDPIDPRDTPERFERLERAAARRAGAPEPYFPLTAEQKTAIKRHLGVIDPRAPRPDAVNTPASHSTIAPAQTDPLGIGTCRHCGGVHQGRCAWRTDNGR